MDDPHLEADFFFGPCNDPACPGSRYASSRPRLELVWPTPEQQQLIEGSDQ